MFNKKKISTSPAQKIHFPLSMEGCDNPDNATLKTFAQLLQQHYGLKLKNQFGSWVLTGSHPHIDFGCNIMTGTTQLILRSSNKTPAIVLADQRRGVEPPKINLYIDRLQLYLAQNSLAPPNACANPSSAQGVSSTKKFMPLSIMLTSEKPIKH